MAQTKVIWEHRPSQGVNLGIFLSCFLVLTWPWALWCYMRTSNTHYILKEEKLLIRKGVRKIYQEEIFLNEIKDVQDTSQFFLKLLGLGCITLFIRDEIKPKIKLSGLEDAIAIKNSILQQIAEVKKVTTVLQRDD